MSDTLPSRSALQPGERRPCAGCGTMIIGARSLVTESRPGHDPTKTPGVLPITLEPNAEKGNVLIQQIDGELRAIVFGKAAPLDALRAHGVQLRLCHFADCPEADQFRRRPPTRPEGNA